MQSYRDLFSGLEDTETNQRNLFDTGHGEQSRTLSCSVCGRSLVRTESGYFACPYGHGKLLSEEQPGPAEESGSWFDPDIMQWEDDGGRAA